ncbi:fibrobacter succinogenes major paralogous domain-containing protein [Elizabethkingia ursingii]|uniref:fibrobacter succinogenes major paralogous domain-containing protein n=1 Tax=Elizabethkingia ursingii TaxID=1756150 RepID=UPI002013B21C|nr:fibrobacter succinogenes major paralogous domain-containing protein [Elizabethkingia ursingii]MCL1668181.1 fibrobacter succinogenes major paralogous domain-containing protein [Elizabethkingia ursingii]
MKKIFIASIYLALGTSGLLLTSCRSTDTESNLVSGAPTAVSFNLTDTEFSNGTAAAQASVDGKGAVITESSVQKQTTMIDPSTAIVAELSPASGNIKSSSQASVGKASLAAVPGSALGAGIQFRVIAYNQADGSFQAFQDYTVGQQAVPMMLNVGATYTMVVYSYGTITLPAVTSGEKTNINNAQVNYDDANRDFMYYNQSNYIPVKGSNVLNITLRHKVAQITTIINSNGMGNIASVANAVLTPHYSNGTIPLSSGVMTGRSTLTTGVPLQFSNTTSTTSVAAPVFINADTGGNKTGSFSADITLGSTTKNLVNTFKITPGYKSNLTININKCGAMVNGVWRVFSCHNMGADATADPFTPAAAIHGAKYQWGAKTGEAGKYVSQADDQSMTSVSGWNNTTNPDNSLWGNTTKGPNDPCPSGYRVPAQSEWAAVFNENTGTRVGNWGVFGTTTYGSAYYISSASKPNSLMLPAAGYRGNGLILTRGQEAVYWSGTPSSTLIGLSLRIDQFTVTSETTFNAGNSKTNGLSVRCISEN